MIGRAFQRKDCIDNEHDAADPERTITQVVFDGIDTLFLKNCPN